jgi:hypothetical protein
MGKRQKELFTETLRVVSEMQRIPLEAAESLRLADVYSGMRAIEDASQPRKRVNTDFDEKEVDLAAERGGKTISLGSRILRTETAAIASVTMCMLYAEMELGEINE